MKWLASSIAAWQTIDALALGVAALRSIALLALVGLEDVVSANFSWKAGSVSLWSATLTLAGKRASIAVFGVSVVALLRQLSIPLAITASGWSGTTGDDVWKADASITKGLRSNTKDVAGGSKSSETVQALSWVGGESLMDRATPARKVAIVQGTESWGRGNNVGIVVAAKLTTDRELSELGESVNGRERCPVVVTGEREVETGELLSPCGNARCSKPDAVLDQRRFAVERCISAYWSDRQHELFISAILRM